MNSWEKENPTEKWPKDVNRQIMEDLQTAKPVNTWEEVQALLCHKMQINVIIK